MTGLSKWVVWHCSFLHNACIWLIYVCCHDFFKSCEHPSLSKKEQCHTTHLDMIPSCVRHDSFSSCEHTWKGLVNKKYLAYAGAMSHTWMRHVTRMNESCHTHEWVMPHTSGAAPTPCLRWKSHATHMDESCHTHGWVMPHTWMSHATHMDESCHTHGW